MTRALNAPCARGDATEMIVTDQLVILDGGDTAALGGTLVELFHYGFERTGGDVGAEHAGYETGWGMTQLSALKEIVEGEKRAL